MNRKTGDEKEGPKLPGMRAAPDGPPRPAVGAPDRPATRRRAPGPRPRIAGTAAPPASGLQRPPRASLERVQPLEDLHRARPGRRVRPPIHVPPGPGAVGPDGQLKPLQQPIIPPAAEDRAQVPFERPGLDPPEHREARGA